nr:MAG TPA: hypothetical protein [Bacteriophage sp.]
MLTKKRLKKEKKHDLYDHANLFEHKFINNHTFQLNVTGKAATTHNSP